MTTFLDTIRSTIARHRMLSPGDTVVVAVSGGADSMALLHALAILGDEFRLTLYVAHFDHQLRPGSAEDVGFVGAAARSLGIPFTVGTADVKALAAEQHRSIEDAARRARYAFLAQVAAETGAGVVATAHTQDDQVETVLMRLLDAAPWELLAGIPPVRPLGGGRVVRPLRALSRTDVVAFLNTRGMTWRDDPSNRDLTLRRNWVRHTVIPGLVQNLSSLGSLLSRASDAVREADGLLTATAGHVFERVHTRGGRALRVPLEIIRVLPRQIQRRLVRKMLAEGTDGGVTRVVEDEALELLARRRPGQVGVGAWVMRRSYEAFEIAPVPAPDPDHVYELTIPGEVAAADFRVRVRADIVDPREIVFQAPGEVTLDADAAGSMLQIRSWRPGDWIRPLGMKGKRKVQDLLVDQKVPRWERGRIPLIVGTGGRVLWVVGVRVSEEARITDRTKRAARLRVLPLEARGSAAGRA